MSKRARASITTALFLVGLFFGNVFVDASGHDWLDYYLKRWRASHEHTGLTPGWHFTPSFPGPGNMRERIEEGFGKWNGLNASLQFDKRPAADSGYDPYRIVQADGTCPSQGYNGIFYLDNLQAHGGEFGRTITCWHTDDSPSGPVRTLHHFSIIMDAEKDWDTGSGDSGRHPFISVATHEIGHAGGFGGHFPASAICVPDEPDYHTMCNGIVPVPWKMATLEEHDKHTFNNAYP